MKRPHRHTYRHLTQEDIASFVDGKSGEIDRARIRVHLECCPDCLEDYRYVVRYRGMHGDIPAAAAPTREALRAAKTLAQRDFLAEHHDRRGRRRWWIDASPAGRFAAAAAVLVVFVAAVVWFRPLPGGSGLYSRAGGVAPITRAVLTASERGPLVLPGAENELGPAAPAFRSGPAEITRELDHALSRLAVGYNDGELAGGGVRLLIAGYLATGQLANARVYIEDARERFPGDRDLAVLAGIFAYRTNDVSLAASLFRSVVDSDPENMVARYNLGIVLAESGDVDGARLQFESVAGAGGPALAGRAAEALKKLSG